LVADDGSRDRTAVVAGEIEGVQVLTSAANEGKGAAIRRALEWCRGGSFAAVILMDADGQHDPGELAVFVDALNKRDWDIIVGNRMGNPVGMPFIRRATNRFMSWVVSRVAGQSVPDSQCGYRALKLCVVQTLSLRTRHFEIESEMLLEAARGGFRIGSVPVRSVYEGGKSKIRPMKDTIRFFCFLFSYLFSKKTG
jgi:glycosyltransferase involved in cell wall biosynthesis